MPHAPHDPDRSQAYTIRRTPTRGRGLFAVRPIEAGTLIVAAPVLPLSGRDRAHVARTVLDDYVFRWGTEEDDKRGACVAFGDVAMCNHANEPTAHLVCDVPGEQLELVALRMIHPGEEITIRYRKRLGFQPFASSPSA